MEARSTRAEGPAPDRQNTSTPIPPLGPVSMSGSPAVLYSISDRSAASHRYRSALDDMQSKPEVNGRLKALLAPVQMTKKGAEEIIQRIREGYYLRPEILHAVAAVVCTVLESEA